VQVVEEAVLVVMRGQTVAEVAEVAVRWPVGHLTPQA